MNDEILELPEVRCPGCDGRDRIIQSLAKEIDRRDEAEREQVDCPERTKTAVAA